MAKAKRRRTAKNLPIVKHLFEVKIGFQDKLIRTTWVFQIVVVQPEGEPADFEKALFIARQLYLHDKQTFRDPEIISVILAGAIDN